MIKFYYSLAPNPMKVALFLEEAGVPYELIPVDTRKGEQHQPAFLAINPNAKVPAIVDGDVTVFDSGAILLYLAEKTGQFLPATILRLRFWRIAVLADVRGLRRRPLFGSGGALQKLRARPAVLRSQPKDVRGPVERIGLLEMPVSPPPLHARRQIYDRRYVCLGLGARGAD